MVAGRGGVGDGVGGPLIAPPPTYLLMLSSMSSCCDVRASYSRKQIMQKSVVRVWARLWGEGHALA